MCHVVCTVNLTTKLVVIMKNTSIISDLTNFGLSQQQSEIYVFVLRRGSARINEITRALSIPRSSIYENLKNLADLGLIEEIKEDTHKRIQAYPISTLKHGYAEQIQKFERMSDELSDVQARLKALGTNPAKKSITMRYYNGVSGARQLFWNSLKTRSEVLVMSSFGRSEFVGSKFYQQFVNVSRENEVQERVLVNPSKQVRELLNRDDGTDLARTTVDQMRAIASEKLQINGETLMYNNIYAHIYLDAEEIIGFEIESRDFCQTQRAMFELLWGQALPLYLD